MVVHKQSCKKTKEVKSMSFLDIIRKSRDVQGISSFEGSFIDYLEIVRKNPELVQLAHQRMYNLITKPGINLIRTEESAKLRRVYGNQIIRKYAFFEEEFFGMDKTLSKIVRYFHAAAMAGEESRQVLYLVGPVGAGKSSLVEALKKALEQGPSIYALAGCPMHEEPLHLVPKQLRSEFEKLLNVHIEGDLCPTCSFRLNNDFNGEYEKFPIETISYSIRGRKGVGVVPPVDPNNQDTSVLTGSIDISKLDRYPEDDPRVMSLNGSFNVGNRGVVEFIEVFKNQPEYLHAMITATQEKSIPSPGKGSMIYFDGIILAHSNEAEWNKFRSDRTNEAIMDRIVKIEVPYCLELDEEIKIYEKILKRSRFDAHIAPHTIKIASMFAILTRMARSNKAVPLQKLKIYNGEEIVENAATKKVDIFELKEEQPHEGMTGISTRFIMKVIDTTLAESEHNCINPIAIMETLVKAVKELPLGEDDRKNYLGFIQDTLKKEFNGILEKEVTKAFIHGYREQAESLFNNYLDHVVAFVNNTKIKDKDTNEELEPDEKFLRSIEEQIGITGTAAKGFRQDVTTYMFSVLRNGNSLSIDSYEPLKEAIEKKLTFSVKELTRVITSAKVRDMGQNKKYNAVVQALKDKGYCDHCCNVILKYAANNLWKD